MHSIRSSVLILALIEMFSPSFLYFCVSFFNYFSHGFDFVFREPVICSEPDRAKPKLSRAAVSKNVDVNGFRLV
jgi:hypothetical protein